MELTGKHIGLAITGSFCIFTKIGQYNPMKKPTSLIAHTGRIRETLQEALDGRQVQPVIQNL